MNLLLGHAVCAVRDEGGKDLHPAQACGLLQGSQELLDRVVVVAFPLVGDLASPGRNGAQERLSAQRRALTPVGPAVLEHQVLPLLQDRRARVPVERVLEDDDVVLLEQTLLPRDVDVEVRVRLVEIVHDHPVEAAHLLRKAGRDHLGDPPVCIFKLQLQFLLVLVISPRYGLAADWLRRNRLRLEFLVVATFCCSTLMVKLLKWTMARPRPKKYFWGTRPFNEWWEVGPYFLDEGTYRASFPSGHTASAITLMGLVYVLSFSLHDKRYRRLGAALFLFTIAFGLTMAVARIMTRAHWPTDVTFSIFGGWALIHLLFFYGIKVTGGDQSGAYRLAELSPPPPFRGIRICWYLSLFCLALVGLFLGLKHFLHERWPWLIIFSIASVPLLVYAALKSFGEGLFRADD